jgi:hypothetical protein
VNISQKKCEIFTLPLSLTYAHSFGRICGGGMNKSWNRCFLKGYGQNVGWKLAQKEWEEFRKRLVEQKKEKHRSMKRWRVFIKRQAEEDANEIWFYIAQDNPQAAEAFLSAIEQPF